MAETIAKATNIDILGIDYISTDISRSYIETKGAINEYNHTPGLFILESVIKQKEIIYEICREIIGKDVGRIPLVIIITSDYKISQIKEQLKNKITDDTVGWVCDNIAYIGQFPLRIYDTSGWSNVSTLLRQKTVEKAVVVCSVEEVSQKGLPVDKANTLYLDNAVNMTNDWQMIINKAALKVSKYSEIEKLIPRIITNFKNNS